MQSRIQSRPDGKSQLLWVGIDVAKLTFEAAVNHSSTADKRGRLQTRGFERTREGAAELLAWANQVIADTHIECTLAVAAEATGSYSSQIGQWIAQLDPTVHFSILNPKQVKDYARSLEMRNKTDKTDARAIARFATERNPAPVEKTNRAYQQLRQLVDERNSLIKAAVAKQNRAHDSEPIALIEKLRAKRKQRDEADINTLDKAIATLVETDEQLRTDIQLLRSIPGVGIVTATTVLAHVGDLRRFAQTRQIAAFIGLSPRLHESGTSVNKHATICRMGSALARANLFMATLSAVKKDGPLARFYNQLVARGKPKKAALVAVARKIAVLMRRVIIDQKPYDPNHQTYLHHAAHQKPQTTEKNPLEQTHQNGSKQHTDNRRQPQPACGKLVRNTPKKPTETPKPDEFLVT